jgi:hypothetical protein
VTAIARSAVEEVVERLVAEDVLGQLLERRRPMAELATEGGRVRLDWVDAMPRWLADGGGPARIEQIADRVLGDSEALLWCGMGGSVMAVRAMLALGLPADQPVRVVPIDSTDPRALNAALHAAGPRRTAAIGVSMGLTSEEPLSHLRWLADRSIGCARRTVMTVPGSMLEQYAGVSGLPTVPLQPDGADGTPGRMSAPGTHVFLLPALLAAGGGTALRDAIDAAAHRHTVVSGMTADERARVLAEHPAAALAARLHLELQEGRDKALLVAGPTTEALGPWVEQLVEESLGKAGRGLLVFPGQSPTLLADPPTDCFLLRVEDAVRPDWSADGIAELAELFAGWTLAVALLGYLQGIPFVGQPAVEGYKMHARELRDAPGSLVLPDGPSPKDAVARVRDRLADDPRGYLDVTLNADEATPGWDATARAARRLANDVLHRPGKARIAPRHYHSTEQAQVDGPRGVHSLRVALQRTEAVRLGDYDTRYLHAQAIGAARAMAEAGRPVELVVLPDAPGLSALTEALA